VGSSASWESTPLVGLIAGNLGWRVSYLFVGLLILATNVPLILFVTKDSPQSIGLLPDGDKPEDIVEVEYAVAPFLPKMLIHHHPKTGLEGKFSLDATG
jgi:sugar phosphate permease